MNLWSRRPRRWIRARTPSPRSSLPARPRRSAGSARAEPLAERFGVAKSSISAVVHYHAHVPEGVLRVALPEFERALLAEIAEDGNVPAERLASDLLVSALRSRAW